jgi:hypothetical protein
VFSVYFPGHRAPDYRELLVKRVHLHHLRIDQLEVEDLRVKRLTILEKERTTDGISVSVRYLPTITGVQ